jgi:hypothetical protein
MCNLVLANTTLDRTAGSHSLAAAGQRERWTVNTVDNSERPMVGESN